MKRIICLILAAVMLIAVQTGFAADGGGSGKEIEILNSIEVFDGLNITFTDSAAMKRADFLETVMHLYTGGNHPSAQNDIMFYDVPDGASYKWAADAALTLGFISGHDDGMFMPNDTISYFEALKIIVCALGYKPVAEANGGFPSGYVSAANRIKIGFSPSNPDGITMGDAARLILNALNTEILELSSFGNDSGIYKTEPNMTWLKAMFGIEKKEGIVTMNSKTALYSSGSNIGENQIMINNTVYDTAADFGDLLGLNAEYYVKDDDTVVYAYSVGNKTLKIDSVDLASDVTGRQITYYKNNRNNTVDIDKEITVIYNGVCVPDYEMSIFNIKNGRIELIAANGSGRYTAAKITEYKTAFITANNVNESFVVDAIGKSEINYKKYDSFYVYKDDGAEIDAAEIPLKSIVCIAESKDKTVAEWYVSADKVRGKIEERGKDGDNEYVVIEAVKIYLAKQNKIDTAVLNVNKNIIAYKDIFGKIAYAEQSSDSENKFAYMIANNVRDSFANKLIFKLYDQDGILSELESANNFYLNGDKVGDVTKLNNFIGKSTAVLYRCDEYGDVKAIYTPDTKGSPLVRICNKGKKMFYPGNSNYVFADENQTAFGGSFCVDENTKMLSIPTNAIDATEKKFNVMNPISFAIFDQYEVEAFTQNPSSNVAQYVLSIDEKSNLSLKNEAYLVVEKAECLDADGDQTYSLELTGKSQKNKTFTISEKSLAEDVETGDIIICNVNGQNEIDNLRVVFDTEKIDDLGNINKFEVANGVEHNGKWYANLGLYNGYIYSQKDNVVNFVKQGENPTSVKRADMLSFKTSNLLILQVDKDAPRARDRIQSVSPDALASYEDNSVCEEVWLYVRLGTPMFMVMYK